MRRKSGHIRDCPEGRDGTKEDGENRIAYEFSHTSALLTELRCAVGPLCDALGCYETDVAALKYAAPPKGSLDVGRQPLHRDFNPECIARLREKVRRKGLRIVTPWTLLVAFTPGAKMYFMTGSTMTIVVLHRPGDAVLFRGDVLHGGASYQVDHWRCHFYLEPRAEVYAPLRGQQTFRQLKSEDKPFGPLRPISSNHQVRPVASYLKPRCVNAQRQRQFPPHPHRRVQEEGDDHDRRHGVSYAR